MKLPDLLGAILDVAKTIVNVEASSLLLSDEEGDLIFNVVIGEKGDILTGEKVPKGKGIAGTVAETGEYLIVNDVEKDPRFFQDMDIKTKFKTKNILAIPMKVLNEFVGVLEIVNTIGRDTFSENDLKKGILIAHQAAVAIANRRMYDDLGKRIEELEALFNIAQSISYSTSDENVMKNIIISLAHSMNVDRASVTIFDENKESLVLEAAYGLPLQIAEGIEIDLDETISGHVFRSADPLIVSDVNLEVPSPLQAIDREYKTKSFISVPILYKNNSIGVLSLSDKKNGKFFDSFDLRVLSTVSMQIAEAYQNVKHQNQVEYQRRLAQEIDIAAEIQKKILPPLPKQFKTHIMTAFNKPAKEIGGDFYDFYPIDENKYAVVVADISGKGIPAALFMGTARNVVRAERRINSSPAKLLKNANNLIYEDSESGMFVTLFYAIIDSHNNVITFGSGGHNDQLLVKADKKEVQYLNAKGKPLGMYENQEYEERVIMFEPGDTLICYTDGVTEALGGADLDIDAGMEKLKDIALQYSDRDPQDMIDYLSDFLESSDLDIDFRDDFTIFIIKM